MDISATSRFVRLSPTKARDLAQRIRGKSVATALGMVTLNERKAAYYVGKTLKSAIANAENNAKLEVDSLKVKEAVVDEAIRMKRLWAAARGSPRPVCKRMCHIRIVLTDGHDEEAEQNA